MRRVAGWRRSTVVMVVGALVASVLAALPVVIGDGGPEAGALGSIYAWPPVTWSPSSSRGLTTVSGGTAFRRDGPSQSSDPNVVAGYDVIRDIDMSPDGSYLWIVEGNSDTPSSVAAVRRMSTSPPYMVETVAVNGVLGTQPTIEAESATSALVNVYDAAEYGDHLDGEIWRATTVGGPPPTSSTSTTVPGVTPIGSMSRIIDRTQEQAPATVGPDGMIYYIATKSPCVDEPTCRYLMKIGVGGGIAQDGTPVAPLIDTVDPLKVTFTDIDWVYDLEWSGGSLYMTASGHGGEPVLMHWAGGSEFIADRAPFRHEKFDFVAGTADMMVACNHDDRSCGSPNQSMAVATRSSRGLGIPRRLAGGGEAYSDGFPGGIFSARGVASHPSSSAMFVGWSGHSGTASRIKMVGGSPFRPAGFYGLSGFVAQQPYAQDPVNTFTGNFVHTEADLASPTGAFGVEFTRTYNSLDEADGLFGPGWRSSVESSLNEHPGTGVVEFTDADGRVLQFIPAAGGSYTSPSDLLGHLESYGAGQGWALQWDSGERWEFTSGGSLRRKCLGATGSQPSPTWCSSASAEVTEYVDYQWSGNSVTVTDGTGTQVLTVSRNNDDTRTQSVSLSVDGVIIKTVTYYYNSTTLGLELAEHSTGERIRYYREDTYFPYITRITEDGASGSRQIVKNTFDVFGRVETQESPNGDLSTFLYGKDGSVDSQYATTVVSETGQSLGGTESETTVYFHDDEGNFRGARDSATKSTGITAWVRGQLDQFTDRRGSNTKNDYDTAGRLIRRTYTNPDSVNGALDSSIFEEWGYVSSTDSRLVSYRNRAGEFTCYSYDPALSHAGAADDGGDGVPSRVTTGVKGSCGSPTNPAAEQLVVTVRSLDGLVLESRDEDGVLTCMEYQARRLWKTKRYCSDASKTITTTIDRAYVGGSGGGWTETVTAPAFSGSSVSTSTYDANGRITSAADNDGLGGPATWAYYPDGRLKTSLDAAGARVCHFYADGLGSGSSHTILELATPNATCPTTAPGAAGSGGDRVTVESYDKADRLVKVTKPGPTSGDPVAETTYTYSKLGRVETESRRYGSGGSYVTSFRYDDDGNLTKTIRGSTEVAAETTETRYDRWGRVTDEFGRAGEDGAPQSHTEYRYDLEGRVLETREYTAGSEYRVTTNVYYPNGLVKQTHNPRGNSGGDAFESRTYTAAGRLDTVTDAVTSLASGAGGVTDYTYEAGTDRIDSVSLPRHYSNVARVLDYTWHPGSGLLSSETSPAGLVTSYGYDVAGRRTSVSSPNPAGGAPVTTVTTYTPRGEVDTVTQPLTGSQTAVTDWDYTAFGEVDRVINPLQHEADMGGAQAATVDYSYDHRGNRTERTSWVSETWVGNTAGALVARTEKWRYNLADQLVAHEGLNFDGSNAEEWTYDPLTGELSTATVGSGSALRVARYAYYNSGAVSSICFDDDTTAESGCADGSSTQLGYRYDHLGRRASMADQRGVTTYAYGDLVNLTQRDEAQCSTAGTGNPASPCTGSGTLGAASTVKWTYDDNNRVTELYYPNSSSPIKVGYYPDGTLHTVNMEVFPGAWGPMATYAVDRDARVTTETLAAGGHRTWTYGTDGKAPVPTHYQQFLDAATTNTDLGWDHAGRLTTSLTSGVTTSYTYDRASQLTSAVTSTTSTSDDWTYTYRQDGTRRTQTTGGATTTYTYNPAKQLQTATTGAATLTYGWDTAGRMTNNGTATLAYNPRGLLETVTPTSSGGISEQRSYNGDGLLVKTTTAISGQWTATSDTAQWDSTTGIPQVIGTTNTLTAGGTTYTGSSGYLFGNLRFFSLATVNGGPVTAAWYGYDHLGSVTPSTNNPAPGAYSPYGEPINTNPSTYPIFPTFYGYRGEQHINGNLYLRARNYTPNTGTFTTPDPLDGVPATPTETNPYHYTDNDPINKADPLGLRPADCNMNSMGECTAVADDLGRIPLRRLPTEGNFNMDAMVAMEGSSADEMYRFANFSASAAAEAGVDPYVLYSVTRHEHVSNRPGVLDEWEDVIPEDMVNCSSLPGGRYPNGTLSNANIGKRAFESVKANHKAEFGGTNFCDLDRNDALGLRVAAFHLQDLEGLVRAKIAQLGIKIVTPRVGARLAEQGWRVHNMSTLVIHAYIRGLWSHTEWNGMNVTEQALSWEFEPAGAHNNKAGYFNAKGKASWGYGAGRDFYCYTGLYQCTR